MIMGVVSYVKQMCLKYISLRVLLVIFIPGGGVPVKISFFFVQVILVLFLGFAVYSGGLLHPFLIFVFCDLVSSRALGFCCCFMQHV